MSTAVSAATRTTWAIDPAHSNLEFSVRHLMITTVKGRFAEMQGTVVLDGTDPARSTVEVAIPAASIDTREPQRDAHLRSADFFDVDRYPALTFKSRRVEGRVDADFRIVGDLTIHGVTREVVLDAASEGRSKDPWGGQRAGFSATTRIKRSEYGLTWNQLLETGGLAVSDDVRIALDVQLVKTSAEA